MTQMFTGMYLTPGERTPLESVENEFTQGRWENRDVIGGLIDSATTDSGNTGYTSILRAGVILGMVTATKKFRVYDPTATNGCEEPIGILRRSIQMNTNNTAVDRFAGDIITGGLVDPNFLIRSASTSTGIVGDTYEYHLRKQLRALGFKFMDSLGETVYGQRRRAVAKTADYTVTAADRNTLFTNSGAAGAVVFTLPATAALGLEYWFYVETDQTVTVTAGTADTMIVHNDIAADSISFQTSSEKVGGALHVRGNGSKWVVTLSLGFESQTVTIAT